MITRPLAAGFARALIGLGCLAVAAAAFAQSTAPGPLPAFTRTIYLVRHGNYDYSKVPADDEGSLNPLGIAQARLVASRLRGMPVAFTSLLTSTLPRARQTAQVIGQALPPLQVQDEPLLRECTPRTWRTDIIKDEKPADLDAAEQQLNGAFAIYFTPAQDADRHDILVCHGNVTRYFVLKALQVDTQAWLGLAVAHCSLTIIQVSPAGTFKVLAVGDAGHIPGNLQSGLGRPDPRLALP